ncbi:hypothetical protein O8B93_06735 [Agrobacterium rhizogenes]|uniref:esterase/lipase family protein n=1 Tax=Rhizobium rhizogenes TaxID=359 RepID=UPI0022B733AE|nr:hypothetical protein [Rhizobium rhizogenes]MCZ7447281.1 hypothetical protein [Rhizobium rhizogenes]
MGSIIFLPGILGSRLKLGKEEIWPPTVGEVLNGYERIDKLTDPAVIAGSPIDSVCLKSVYKPLLDDLQVIASGHAGAVARSLHSFGYDWRIDLRTVASDIASRIDALPPSDRNEIHFVAHSMGNLVLRLLLESGTFDKKPWFSNIRTLVSLAGPHRGAPTALVRALGLEGTLGLAGPDIRKMAKDIRYPSLYQLLPQPGIVAAWRDRGSSMVALDIYDRTTAAALDLNATNLKVAKDTHAILARNKKPAHVTYVYLAGTSEDTWIRVNTSVGQPRPVAGKDAGDGTVPLWSAVEPTQLHHVAPGVHAEIFKHEQIRALIYRSLGARIPSTNFVSAADKPLLMMQTGELAYAKSSSVDVMVIPSNGLTEISGDLVIEFTYDPIAAGFAPFQRIPLSYKGPQIDQIKVRLPNLTRVGFYRIGFDGTHEVGKNEHAIFAISPVGASGAKS